MWPQRSPEIRGQSLSTSMFFPYLSHLLIRSFPNEISRPSRESTTVRNLSTFGCGRVTGAWPSFLTQCICPLDNLPLELNWSSKEVANFISLLATSPASIASFSACMSGCACLDTVVIECRQVGHWLSMLSFLTNSDCVSSGLDSEVAVMPFWA